MKKLLFQSDDFGITEAVTLGIVKGIETGLVRNTGLFTNMPSSEFAASFIKKYPHCNFGVDINLVAGKPLSNPADIPNLVDEQGNFISSIEHYKRSEIKEQQALVTSFNKDPFTYEEAYLEADKQVQKYIELTGKNPDYIHPHSLITPVVNQVLSDLAKKYNIVYSLDFYKTQGFKMFPADWNIKPVFKVEDQLKTDVAQNVLDRLDAIEDDQVTVMICHCGYVDAQLLKISSYSLIRTKDLEMATSEKLQQALQDAGVQLVTYRDLM